KARGRTPTRRRPAPRAFAANWRGAAPRSRAAWRRRRAGSPPHATARWPPPRRRIRQQAPRARDALGERRGARRAKERVRVVAGGQEGDLHPEHAGRLEGTRTVDRPREPVARRLQQLLRPLGGLLAG